MGEADMGKFILMIIALVLTMYTLVNIDDIIRALPNISSEFIEYCINESIEQLVK